jgi:hypothetical protein
MFFLALSEFVIHSVLIIDDLSITDYRPMYKQPLVKPICHTCVSCIVRQTSNTVVVVTEREARRGMDDPEAGARHQHEGQGLPGESVFRKYPTATVV